MMRASLLGLLLAWAGTATAIEAEQAFGDPAMQARYEKLTRELRCLVCQNQTIADSNADVLAVVKIIELCGNSHA